jgi:hypothetical protein
MLGLLSINSVISGAMFPFDLPTKSFNKSILIFKSLEILIIISFFGAVRFSFSISLRYDAAIPILIANSLCPNRFLIFALE